MAKIAVFDRTPFIATHGSLASADAGKNPSGREWTSHRDVACQTFKTVLTQKLALRYRSSAAKMTNNVVSSTNDQLRSM